MPEHAGRGLDDTYGVVAGSLLGSRQDPPSGRGRYNHFHVVVDTLHGLFNCAINLGSARDHDVVFHFRRDLDLRAFPRLRALVRRRTGFYPLQPEADSGALDILRHPELVRPPFQTNRAESWRDAWEGSERQPLNRLLETVRPMLDRTTRVYVLGALVEANPGGRFELHEVHVNQGDSPFHGQSVTNGPWQDGGLIMEYDDREDVAGHGDLRWRWTRRYALLITRFRGQSLDPGEH
jgi:hypothetical protein